MKRVAILSALLLMAGLCFAQATVAGHAYVFNNGPTIRPVAGATIVLTSAAANAGLRTVSARDGSFSFANVRPGTYLLTSMARGYTSTRPVVVTIRANTTTRVIADTYLIPVVTRPITDPENNRGGL